MSKKPGTDFDNREERTAKSSLGGKTGRRRAMANQLFAKAQSFSRSGLGWNAPVLQGIENFSGLK